MKTRGARLVATNLLLVRDVEDSYRICRLTTNLGVVTRLIEPGMIWVFQDALTAAELTGGISFNLRRTKLDAKNATAAPVQRVVGYNCLRKTILAIGGHSEPIRWSRQAHVRKLLGKDVQCETTERRCSPESDSHNRQWLQCACLRI